ncbi:MAG: ROK family glucokinase [Actinomycetota bacterium]
MSLTIGVDIGGTKVAAGVVDEAGAILAQVKRATPSDSPAETVAVIAACVQELVAGHAVSAVGVGAAGFVDADRSTVLFAPNVAWRDEPLRAAVEQACRLPVIVENDANAAAWGEVRFGAGRGHRFVVVVTVGTGIGGGFVLNGELYRGRWGIGAEIGHINVVPQGRRCGCGNLGCWEQYASGRALEREARELAAAPVLGARLLELAGGQVSAISGPEITQAAREGDAAAVESFRVVGTWLGHGLADLAAALDPGLFVLGGGVSEAGELLAGPARRSFRERLTGRGHRPYAEVRLAELGAEAGLVGAADLARYR